MTTLELIATSAARAPLTTAIIYQIDARPGSPILKISYQSLLNSIYSAASLLRANGVNRESPVAIIAPNIPSTHIAIWAAQLAGRAFPINYLLGAEHVAALLKLANVRHVIALGTCSELSIDKTVGAALELLAVEGIECQLIEIDANEIAPSAQSFQGQINSASPAIGKQLLQEIHPQTIAAIFHTGGTTGLPKLLVHTHGNEVHTSSNAPAFYDFKVGDVMVNGFPLFHVAGTFVYGLSVLAAGGTLYIPTMLGMRNSEFVSNAWKLFEEHGVTHLGCVPTMLIALQSSYLKRNQPTPPNIRVALTGGSPLSSEVADQFERTTRIPVRNIFGMTECAGIVAIEPFHLPRITNSCGLAIPGTEVKAVALHSIGQRPFNEFCQPNEVGIICIKGPHVSLGYINPELNGDTFTSDGWLISGDIGYVDSSGHIFITGRAKDLIIRSGHNIDPQMIEEAFMQHPAVLACAAVGKPDSYAGEIPVVFVTLKSTGSISPEQLLEDVKPFIAEPPAIPKAVHIIDSLPMTPVGKIYKPALREIAISNMAGSTPEAKQ